jgi:hypothetical protein
VEFAIPDDDRFAPRDDRHELKRDKDAGILALDIEVGITVR